MDISNNSTVGETKYTNLGTHETHCCARHGCKYGKSCPVEDKVVIQAYACPECFSSKFLKEQIAKLNEELAWSEQLEARGLHVESEFERY